MAAFTTVRDNRGLTYTAPLATPVVTTYGTARFVGYWFNREERAWVVALYEDGEGRSQVGASEYLASKDDCLSVAADLLSGISL